jgi:hypothetical protein
MRKLDKGTHEKKTNGLGHLQRTPTERAPKKLLYCQLIGRSDPGRPRRRWLLIFEGGTG